MGLQEVDRGVERSGKRDLLKEIADLAGMRFVFGKNIDHQGGDYGNALLTSRPIVSEGNRLLPNTDGGEQRGVLQVVLDVEGTQVLVLTTHLDARRPDPQRIESAGAMLGMIQARHRASRGDGRLQRRSRQSDLDPPDDGAHRCVGDGRQRRRLHDPRRGAEETHRLDSGAGLEPVSAEVLKTDASDHLPVVATLRVR